MNRINGFGLTLSSPPVSGGVSMLKFQVLLSHYRAMHYCQRFSQKIDCSCSELAVATFRHPGR